MNESTKKWIMSFLLVILFLVYVAVGLLLINNHLSSKDVESFDELNKEDQKIIFLFTMTSIVFGNFSIIKLLNTKNEDRDDCCVFSYLLVELPYEERLRRAGLEKN